MVKEIIENIKNKKQNKIDRKLLFWGKYQDFSIEGRTSYDWEHYECFLANTDIVGRITDFTRLTGEKGQDTKPVILEKKLLNMQDAFFNELYIIEDNGVVYELTPITHNPLNEGYVRNKNLTLAQINTLVENRNNKSKDHSKFIELEKDL